MTISKQIKGQLQNIDVDKIRHNYNAVSISPEQFSRLDPEFFENKTREIVSLGFQLIGDIECRHESGFLTESTTFRRLFINPKRNIVAEIIQILSANITRQSKHISFYSFTSEFTNGLFLDTHNIPPNDFINSIDGVISPPCNSEMTIKEMFDLHKSEAVKISNEIQVDLRTFNNQKEILGSAEREYTLMREELRKRGNYTKKEMLQMSPEIMLYLRPTVYRMYRERHEHKLDDCESSAVE